MNAISINSRLLLLALLCLMHLCSHAAEETQENASAVERLADRIAFALLRNGPSAALQELSENDSDAAKEMHEILQTVRDLPKALIASIKTDIGKTVNIQLSERGTIQVKIESVNGSRVSGFQQVERGELRIRFDLNDLTPLEKFRRLGKEETPALHICRGLLALEAEREDIAAKYFNRAETELGAALIRQLQRQEEESAETAAKDDWDQLMARLRLPPDADAGEVEQWTQKREFSEDEIAFVQNAINWFRRRHGKTQFAEQHQAVLENVEAVQVTVEKKEEVPKKNGPPTMGEMEKVIEQLKALNRDTGELKWTYDEEKAVLDLSGNREMKDISALKGLQLKELNIGATGVEDLTPLKDMPLKSLSASVTRIRDVSPLSEMPLQELNLWGTLVENLRPLSALPLCNLRIASHVKDLSSFSHMMLKSLSVAGEAITSVRPLEGMPLQNLNISGTSVGDLSPLQGMPLAQLRLGPKVTSLTPLRDMQLRQLYLLSCHLLSLRDLDGMPLETLVVQSEHVTVRNLDMIAKMPLRTLILDCKGASDVRPLAACKTLERLVIPSDARNIEWLKKLPNLKYLDTQSGTQPQLATEFWRIWDAVHR